MGMGKGLRGHSLELFSKTLPKQQTLEGGKGEAVRRLYPGALLPDVQQAEPPSQPWTVQALSSRPMPSREPGQRVCKPEGHRARLWHSQPLVRFLISKLG